MTADLAALGATPVRSGAFPIEEPTLGEEEFAAVDAVMRSRSLSVFSSPEVGEFEREFAAFVGTPDAVAVTSGTAALHAALAGLERPQGSRVLVPVYTYAATVNAIYLAGFVPEFVDLDSGSPNISIAAAAAHYSDDVVALLGVDLFGIPFDRAAATELCESLGIYLIEDCAQSVGARWDGQRVGSFGLGCHSFGEIKNMTSAEGGMVTADDPELLERVRAVRHAGEVWRESGRSTIGPHESSIDDLTRGMDYLLPGHNYRMNAIQGAIGRVQLTRLDALNRRRGEIYSDIASAASALERVELFHLPDGADPVANRCALLLRDSGLSRRAVLYALMAEGIPAGVYYPTLHTQTTLARARGTSLSEAFPNAQRVIDHHLLVPCYPAMTETDATDVADAVVRVLSADLTPDEIDELEGRSSRARATYFGQFFTLA